MNGRAGKACVALPFCLFAASLAVADELVREDSHGWQSHYAATGADAVPQRYWQGDVRVQVHVQPDEFNMAAGVAWAVWSWQERAQKAISVGPAAEVVTDGASGKVVFTIISDLDMFLMTGDFMTRATTSSWYYTPGGEMAGAVVYVRRSVFANGLDRCAMQVLVHELGHAISITAHSLIASDVMFASGADGCRYSLSTTDIKLAGYGVSDCHAELNLHGDIYIPYVMGSAAELVHVGGYRWQLGGLDLSLGSCSRVVVDQNNDVRLEDLRGADGGWHHVDLGWLGYDAWGLEYAE